ncbi:hypothetical protein GQ42DRAFT_162264 [Ramicandelaber brevisporus]|nr:hypothetical protein GQ42DRAFT_162264 [Ramicandelaber brevisporus]
MCRLRLFLFLSTNTFLSYKYCCPRLQVVLVFWLHCIPLLLPLSRGFRSVSLSACLSGYSFHSFGRSFRITHLLGFKPADQDASRSLLTYCPHYLTGRFPALSTGQPLPQISEYSEAVFGQGGNTFIGGCCSNKHGVNMLFMRADSP